MSEYDYLRLRWWHNKWFVNSVGVTALLVIIFGVWLGTRVIEESARILWQKYDSVQTIHDTDN